ncbi:MAG TPA: hypothetical protein VFE94_04100 [Candidatus Paceibacterota bacterium]|nr:hypothetical protein [Candidatus Paceibacterota bacterium]
MPKKTTHYLTSKTEHTAHLVEKLVQEKRKAAFNRWPLLFTLLGAFGLVATFYGFEGVMDQTGLSENPWILLALGIGVLIFTGSLYKKLGD